MASFMENLRRIYGLPDKKSGIESRNGSIFEPSNVFAESEITVTPTNSRQATPAQIERIIKQGKGNQFK